MTKLRHKLIVVLGHVDHGKSTLLGRLLADTNSLPQGKLQQAQVYCQEHGKQFEYAYLLDALKTERTQGITLDTARTYIKTKRSWLTIIDVPGHKELIRNMVSGADRAEYGLLVIDAKRGIQENTKKHCYLAHFLGIKKTIVCFNKMDKVAYSEKTYVALVKELEKYTKNIGIHILASIPISASQGVNIISRAEQTPWYKGKPVLAVLDGILPSKQKVSGRLRFPVQDIYGFTQNAQQGPIWAGTVSSGKCILGEAVLVMPEQQPAKISALEQWPDKKKQVVAGTAVGLRLNKKINNARPGGIICGTKQPCLSGTAFTVLLFWFGKNTLKKNKKYVIQTLVTKVTGKIAEADRTVQDMFNCKLVLNELVAIDIYAQYPETGRITVLEEGRIVGVGLIIGLVKE